MKNKLILLLTSFLLAGTSVGAKVSSPLVSFKVTPLSKNNLKSYMEIKVMGSSLKPINVSVYIVNDLFDEGKLIFSRNYKGPKTEVVEYDNTYTRDENSIKVVCKDIKTGVETTKNLEVRLVTTSNNTLDSSEQTYYSKGLVSEYTEQYGLGNSRQRITFKGFEDIYFPDFYHKIDLSNFRIQDKISINLPLFYESATFSITNLDGVFNAFSTESSITLPLSLVLNDNNEYYLSFENKLYVNPITLEMSPVYKNGFVQTNHFYLPRNGKKKESAYDCAIKLNRVGIDYANFYSRFKYKSILNTLGNCRNSQYCIVNK